MYDCQRIPEIGKNIWFRATCRAYEDQELDDIRNEHSVKGNIVHHPHSRTITRRATLLNNREDCLVMWSHDSFRKNINKVAIQLLDVNLASNISHEKMKRNFKSVTKYIGPRHVPLVQYTVM